MKAIIFNTEAEGIERAEEEGRDSGFPYFIGTGITRYRTLPRPTNDNKWALIVDDYEHLMIDDVVVDITVDDLLVPEEEGEE